LEAYDEKSNYTERVEWRWRRATYGFNLTISDFSDFEKSKNHCFVKNCNKNVKMRMNRRGETHL